MIFCNKAMGTPGAWTTNDETNTHYYAPNTFGEHYWFVVMEMDCSQTQVSLYKYMFPFKPRALLTQCPCGTVQTGTGKVDPARKFKFFIYN